MNFSSRYSRLPGLAVRKSTDPYLVDKTGYLPARAAINAMISSGQALISARDNLRYEYEGKLTAAQIRDAVPDPTLLPGFNRQDADLLRLQLEARLSAAVEAQHASDASKQSGKAVDAPAPDTAVVSPASVS